MCGCISGLKANLDRSVGGLKINEFNIASSWVCRTKPSSSGPRPVEGGRPLGPDDGGCDRPWLAPACSRPSPFRRLVSPPRFHLPVMPESNGSSRGGLTPVLVNALRELHAKKNSQIELLRAETVDLKARLVRIHAEVVLRARPLYPLHGSDRPV